MLNYRIFKRFVAASVLRLAMSFALIQGLGGTSTMLAAGIDEVALDSLKAAIYQLNVDVVQTILNSVDSMKPVRYDGVGGVPKPDATASYSEKKVSREYLGLLGYVAAGYRYAEERDDIDERALKITSMLVKKGYDAAGDRYRARYGFSTTREINLRDGLKQSALPVATQKEMLRIVSGEDDL